MKEGTFRSMESRRLVLNVVHSVSASFPALYSSSTVCAASSISFCICSQSACLNLKHLLGVVVGTDDVVVRHTWDAKRGLDKGGV